MSINPGARPKPSLQIPLRLAPVFKEKIWGRQDLAPLFPAPERTIGKPKTKANRSAHSDRKIGEAWLTDDSSKILNGPLAGRTLGEISAQYGSALWGAAWKGSRFPILSKFLFTSDWLSIQVHPDNEQARRLSPGSLGKSEMWYIVGAGREAKALLGVKSGVGKEELRTACQRGASRHCLREWTPRAGEAIFVPPGTIHALGPGLILFEAEQNSDVTYRLDDFGRVGQDGKPRPLHLGHGFEVARLDAPVIRLAEYEFREPYGSRRYVLATRLFAVEALSLEKIGSFNAVASRAELVTVIEGGGRIETEAGWYGYHPGDTWLIPPGEFLYRVGPRLKTRLLKYYVPDLERDFRDPRLAKRLSKSGSKRIIFE